MGQQIISVIMESCTFLQLGNPVRKYRSYQISCNSSRSRPPAIVPPLLFKSTCHCTVQYFWPNKVVRIGYLWSLCRDLVNYPEHRGLNTINWLFNWDFSFFFKFSFLLILGIDFLVSGIDSVIDFLVLIFWRFLVEVFFYMAHWKMDWHKPLSFAA